VRGAMAIARCRLSAGQSGVPVAAARSVSSAWSGSSRTRAT
jgi:hypothetical protein